MGSCVKLIRVGGKWISRIMFTCMAEQGCEVQDELERSARSTKREHTATREVTRTN